MNVHKRAYLILLVLLAIALGTPVMADGHMQGKDGEGDPLPPCDCGDGEDPHIDCCPVEERPGGEPIVPGGTLEECQPVEDPGPGGGDIDLQVCNFGGGSNPMYEVYNIDDGIGIRYSDAYGGGDLPCLGLKESSNVVGMLALRLPGGGKVARIEKFLAHEIPEGNGIGGAAGVYIQINQSSFTVRPVNGMTVGILNDAIEAAIATRFAITSYDQAPRPYWIIGEKHFTQEYPYLVSLRTDDAGLVTMNIELRPEVTPADYDQSCGDAYY